MKRCRDARRGLPDYSSYLVRLWRFDRGTDVAWRVSATQTDGGEEVILGGLEELVEHLGKDAGRRVSESKTDPV